MRIKQELLERNSDKEFKRSLLYCLDAGISIVHVRTSEIQRALVHCRLLASEQGTNYTEWDITRGFTEYDASDYEHHTKAGDRPQHNFERAMEEVIAGCGALDVKKAAKFFVFTDPSFFWNSPAAQQTIRVAAASLSVSDTCFIFVTSDKAPPPELRDLVTTVRLNPPGFSELREIVEETFGPQRSMNFIGADDEDVVASLCFAGAGMGENVFRDALSMSIIIEREESEDGATVELGRIVGRVSEQKTKIVNNNEILELYPSEDMSHVGGMENLKEWITRRKACYSDEAADMGIEPPKGVVLVGIPGTGKSLVAKAVSSVFGVPLVRLDFGKVFNSLVGSSEERIREALRMVEFMAPVVMLVDEIDKGLGGVAGGGGGDSGTSQRVFGTFLTWLQECKAPVFCIVTANNIDQLPPELSRKGRFDNVFFTGLPDVKERRQVLSIHLAKRGWEEFEGPDMNLIVQACNGFVHAEIEAVVKDGLISAFADGEDFTADHVIRSANETIPLSKSYFTEIAGMLAWCHQNATPASKRYEPLKEAGGGNVATLPKKRSLRTRKTEKDEE